jgi:signal peptidase II
MTQNARPSVAIARMLGFAVAGVAFVLDQAVKWAIIGPLALPRVEQITLLPIFNLTWAENFGVSLGLFTAGSDMGRWALVGMTALIAIGVTAWLLMERDKGETMALGLVLGGALGNILDRATRGFVVDYADLHFGDFRPFLIFNLADAAISLGVLIILARSFLSRNKRGQTIDTAPQTAPET